jgi:hypothetical protein
MGPRWLHEAKSYDLLLFGANIFKPFIDENMDYIKKTSFAADKQDEKDDKPERKSKNDEIEDIIEKELGYERPQIEKMQRLIEIVR